MIENRDLKPGMVLEATYKKKDYRVDVVKGEDGKLVYRLQNGKEFTSPFRAGTEVMGGVACNGWRFWSVAAGSGAERNRMMVCLAEHWASRSS